MSDQNTNDYYAGRAAKERVMADLAATPAARAIHLALAQGYDARVVAASPRVMAGALRLVPSDDRCVCPQ
jgi:hypothetical protein